jgi:uncharacterized membrane protein YkoI
MIKRIIPILMFAGTLAFTGAAIAQPVAQSSVMKGDVIATFHGDQNTLISAIGKIEQSSGGKVLEIRYSPRQGAPGYHAVVAKGGQVSFVHLDASSQKITPVDANSSEPWMDNWRSRSDVKLAGKAQVPLVEAIRTAQQFKSGPAVAAGIARSASNPESDVHAYNVLVAVDGRASRVAVDDSTGQVIADPSALSGF